MRNEREWQLADRFSSFLDAEVWVAWILAMAGMPTQYSAANAAITTKAIGKAEK